MAADEEQYSNKGMILLPSEGLTDICLSQACSLTAARKSRVISAMRNSEDAIESEKRFMGTTLPIETYKVFNIKVSNRDLEKNFRALNSSNVLEHDITCDDVCSVASNTILPTDVKVHTVLENKFVTTTKATNCSKKFCDELKCQVVQAAPSNVGCNILSRPVLKEDYISIESCQLNTVDFNKENVVITLRENDAASENNHYTNSSELRTLRNTFLHNTNT